jgi:serine/threonine protein kinase
VHLADALLRTHCGLLQVEEGAYGVVFRVRDRLNGDIKALKRLKMEKEKEGFPITALREINTLLKCKHPVSVPVSCRALHAAPR